MTPQSDSPPSGTEADDAELETEPYTIFDKRQKTLIVVISSIAATCKTSLPILSAPHNNSLLTWPSSVHSLRIRGKQLLSRPPGSRRRLQRLHRPDQSYRYFLPALPRNSTQPVGPHIRCKRSPSSLLLHIYRLARSMYRTCLGKELCYFACAAMSPEHGLREHNCYRVGSDWRYHNES